MPIKKRKEPKNVVDTQLASGVHTYHGYREQMWRTLDRVNFNFHASRFEDDGKIRPLDLGQVVLNPKKSLMLKDIWHCGSKTKARMVVRHIAAYADVTYIEFRGTWVWVEWDHQGKDHKLPDQPEEARFKRG